MPLIVTFAGKSTGTATPLKTAVVILNWNGKHLLEEFIPVLVKHTEGKARLIVADNASGDDSIAWLEKHYPQVELIRNHTNEGFARGYNTALQQVDSDYYLLLNSDVEVTEGWLEPLEKFLNNHPEAAVCQPKILWYKQRDQFEYAGAAGGYIDQYGYPFCRGRIFGNLEKDKGQYNDTIPVFWASGACMLVRSDVFKKVEGFDASFFAHMEEIDLCWRIRNLGYEIYCVPGSTVFHVGGATLPKNNPGKTLLNFRNNLSMLYKNIPGNRMYRVILLRLFLDGIAGIKFLLEGHGADCMAVMKAHFQFYRWVLNGTISRNRSLPEIKHRTIYHGNIAWSHYIKGIKKFSELNFSPDQSNHNR